VIWLLAQLVFDLAASFACGTRCAEALDAERPLAALGYALGAGMGAVLGALVLLAALSGGA
jgi:hypothetical protein